jgi:hypothetical protein
MARKSDLTLTVVQREYILNLTQDALGSIRIHDDQVTRADPRYSDEDTP